MLKLGSTTSKEMYWIPYFFTVLMVEVGSLKTDMTHYGGSRVFSPIREPFSSLAKKRICFLLFRHSIGYIFNRTVPSSVTSLQILEKLFPLCTSRMIVHNTMSSKG